MTAKKRPVAKAKKFWKALAAEAPELHRAVFAEGFAALRRAHSRVGELLAVGEIPFLYEMTNEGRELVLIFTSEWNREVAEEIAWFVSLAPSIPGWKLYTGRQRKGCDLAFDMLKNALGADARGAQFSVVDVEGGLHLTMHSRVWDAFEPSHREGAVRFFLSHALGEQLMMDHVVTVALVPPAQGAQLLTAEEMVEIVLKKAGAP